MTETLGTYIERRREGLGWSQKDLAIRSEVPATTVNRIERGVTKLPEAGVRRRLAEALGVRHVDLLIAAGELTEEEVDASEEGTMLFRFDRDETVREIASLLAVLDPVHDAVTIAAFQSIAQLTLRVRSQPNRAKSNPESFE